MQIPDDDVESMLLRLTFLSVLDISAIITVHRKEPHRRQGQRALAHHLTAIVHGDDAARSAAIASEVIFGGRPAGLDRPSLEMLANEVGFTGVGDEELQNGLDPAELFVRSGLARSKGEVRKNAHGFRVNGSPVDLDRSIGADDLLAGYAAMLSHGKRKHHLLVHADSVVG